MTHHKQVSIYNPIYKEYFEVDEGLADALKLIWDIGLPTAYSCQEREDKDGMVMIHFFSVLDAQPFVSTVLKNGPKIINEDGEPTYQRIIRHGCRHYWKFDLFPDRLKENGKVNDIYFSATVFFLLMI